MQMYKGLSTITNKVSEAEKENIPHHILDQINLEEQPWTVTNFQSQALRIIREIRSRNKCPILVGGTHYYTEAVLFNDIILPGQDRSTEVVSGVSEPTFPILDAPTSEIRAKLVEVDPKMALRWHPSDRRKIKRSLEIWLQTGRTASQIYNEQKQRKLDLLAGGPGATKEALMANSTLIFWLRADADALNQRLEDRVDAMLASGLVQDLQAITRHERDLITAGIPPDKTRGIWVSIGYKEMSPYLAAIDALSQPDPDLERIKSACIESTKSATRQYAHRQERWIRHHLSRSLTAAGAMDTLYPLDSTKPEHWTIKVRNPAMAITQTFLTGNNDDSTSTLPDPETISEMARETISAIRAGLENRHSKDNTTNTDYGCRHCEVCNKFLMTEKEWTGHLKSRSHFKALAGKRKWEAFKAWQVRQAKSSHRRDHDHNPDPGKGEKEEKEANDDDEKVVNT